MPVLPTALDSYRSSLVTSLPTRDLLLTGGGIVTIDLGRTSDYDAYVNHKIMVNITGSWATGMIRIYEGEMGSGPLEFHNTSVNNTLTIWHDYAMADDNTYLGSINIYPGGHVRFNYFSGQIYRDYIGQGFQPDW